MAVPDLPNVRPASDAILLDVDGTLLDLAATPESVHVPDPLKATLARLLDAGAPAVALISGRVLRDLDRIFAPLLLPAVGCHGAEMRASPTGPVEHFAEPMNQLVKDAFAEIAHRYLGVWMEDKTYTLALHYRAAPECASDLLRRTRACRDGIDPRLRLLRGKAVVEVRQPGFDKGIGLRNLMRNAPFAGRRPIFLGDDVTDEDVLAALSDYGGIGIGVGRELKGAALRLSTPGDVRDWLTMIALALEDASP